MILGRFAQRVVARLPALRLRGGLSYHTAQEHVALNITKRCNQRCVFCFEGDREGWDEPSFQRVQGLLREAAQTHRSVIFMGAEALLRKDILEVLRYGKDLGLTVKVFTNGQRLAREGFVTELAQAGLGGLSISFHYADAETFSLGTGVPARFFDRLIRGLENVEDHNRRHPDLAFPIWIETVLFRFNYGRLEQIGDLLRQSLGESFRGLTLKSLMPTECSRTDECLLEPLAARREELTDYLRRFPSGRTVTFSMVPLCLLPGNEHRSLDVIYKGLLYDVRANFEDKRRLQQIHLYSEYFHSNPYRWVCQDCNLLPICPTTRTNWSSPIAAPRRDQKPLPVFDRTAEQVLSKAVGSLTLRLRHRGEFSRARKMWNPKPVPEWTLMRELRALGGEGIRVLDAYIRGRPVFEVVLDVDGWQVHLEVSGVVPDTGSDSHYLVKYLVLQVRGGKAVPKTILFRVLKRFSARPFPLLEKWKSLPGLHLASSRAALTAWHVFGDRLWPGHGRFGDWRTTGVRFLAGALAVGVTHPGGAEAEVLIQSREFRDVMPIGSDSRLAVGSESVKVYVQGDAEATTDGMDPCEDLVRTLNEVVRLSGDISPASEHHDQMDELAVQEEDASANEEPETQVDMASAGATHSAPESSRQDMEGSGFGIQPYTLRVLFKDRLGRLPDHVFFIGTVDADSRVFLQHGNTGLSYRPVPIGRPFRHCAAVLIDAMKSMNEPPDEQNGQRWIRAVRDRFARTPLSRRFDCDVGQM